MSCHERTTRMVVHRHTFEPKSQCLPMDSRDDLQRHQRKPENGRGKRARGDRHPLHRKRRVEQGFLIARRRAIPRFQHHVHREMIARVETDARLGQRVLLVDAGRGPLTSH